MWHSFCHSAARHLSQADGSSTSDSLDTHTVMEEVMRHLKKTDRMNMYDEFSLMKMLTGIIQVVIVFLLLLSLWGPCP